MKTMFFKLVFAILAIAATFTFVASSRAQWVGGTTDLRSVDAVLLDPEHP